MRCFTGIFLLISTCKAFTISEVDLKEGKQTVSLDSNGKPDLEKKLAELKKAYDTVMHEIEEDQDDHKESSKKMSRTREHPQQHQPQGRPQHPQHQSSLPQQQTKKVAATDNAETIPEDREGQDNLQSIQNAKSEHQPKNPAANAAYREEEKTEQQSNIQAIKQAKQEHMKQKVQEQMGQQALQQTASMGARVGDLPLASKVWQGKHMADAAMSAQTVPMANPAYPMPAAQAPVIDPRAVGLKTGQQDLKMVKKQEDQHSAKAVEKPKSGKVDSHSRDFAHHQFNHGEGSRKHGTHHHGEGRSMLARRKAHSNHHSSKHGKSHQDPEPTPCSTGSDEPAPCDSDSDEKEGYGYGEDDDQDNVDVVQWSEEIEDNKQNAFLDLPPNQGDDDDSDDNSVLVEQEGVKIQDNTQYAQVTVR